MKITLQDWVSKTDENLFYADLIATVNGVECGCMKKNSVNKLCGKNGYTFDWKDYSLNQWAKK